MFFVSVEGKFSGYRVIAFALLIITVGIFLSACQITDPISKLPKLPDGTYFEDYVPENPTLVATYFSNDIEQQSQFEKHISAITQEKGNGVVLLNYLNETFVKSSFFRYFNPALLEKGVPKTLVTFWRKSEADPMEFLAVSYFDDVSFVRQTFLKAKDAQEEAHIIIIEENGNIQFETTEGRILFGVLSGNKLVIGSKKEFLSPLPKNTFFNNSSFRTFLSKAPRKFSGYAFTDSSFNAGPEIPILKELQSSSLMVYGAEEDGIFLNSFRKPLNHANISLAKKIPAKNAMFVMEATNFDYILKLESEILKNTPMFRSLYGDNPLKTFEENTGLSYEKDLKPFLQENFAMTVEDQGKILPAVSLWIDASGNPEGASKVIKKLDETLSTLVTVLNIGATTGAAENPPPQKPLLERKDADFLGSPLHQIVFTLQNFPQDQQSIPLFATLNETWAFTYGLTKDNILILSTRSEYPTNTPGQAKPKMLTDQELYQELKSKIRGYGKTDFVYFEAAPFLSYLENILKLGRDSSRLSPKEKKGFEIIKKYLSPFKGGIGGTRVKGEFAESRMFLKIQN